MTTVLRLERKGTLWRAHRQSYDLVLDGAVVATVANGEATSVAVESGHHAVWLATPGGCSAVITVDIGPDETAAFRCHAGRRGRPVLEADPTAMPLAGDAAHRSLRRPA
jgi:hypothetical protein